jgi:phosphatidylglycerol lysyltransferase
MPLVALGLFGLAIWVLHQALSGYHLSEIREALHAVPAGQLLLALLLTGASYLTLGGYDTLALRYLGKPLPYRKSLPASFVSYAFANNTGSWSIIASSTVRYRFYGALGLSGEEVARIIGFCMLTFWLGVLSLGGSALLLEPLPVPAGLPLFSDLLLRLLGLLALLAVGAYLVASLKRQKPLPLGRMNISLPSPRLAAAQVLTAVVDLLCTCAALYVLLPAETNLHFPVFVGLYFLALLIGLASNVPGGLGVFETVMLLLLAPSIAGPAVIGALLLFRVIYYLLPLALAALLLGAIELHRRRAGLGRLASLAGRLAATLAPQVMALAVFTGGAVLLISGALPTVGSRLAWLSNLLPLSIIEYSHFLGSMIGMVLLVMAAGLRRRLDMAYALSMILLAAGIIFSLLKGGDYEEALWLALLLFSLYGSRDQFRRKASLLSETLSPGWIAAVLIVLAGSTWLGFFVHRHHDYTDELWWQFTIHGDAPRFLRATVGAFGVGIFLALLRLSRPDQPLTAKPTTAELAEAAAIAGRSDDTTGYLALLGDKSLLFSTNRQAFLMYTIKGRCWVAMGDPIGPSEERQELLWEFRNLCDEHGGWPVFYEVGKAELADYIDLGLNVLKIGEEGRVELSKFSLEGGRFKGLRNLHHRLLRDGCSFTVHPAAEVENLLPELAEVSRAWLADKKAGEKGFSLGSFHEDYLRRLPVAVVRREGRILAFANLWPGGNREELSPDLMRYHPEAPSGIMDFLFVSMMLWGREQGYRWFSFGMTPLAGLEQIESASGWGRVGAFVFRHGEHFYNFQGLRDYKDKFAPVWQGRYLAYPGALTLPGVLLSLTALIGGGLKSALGK